MPLEPLLIDGADSGNDFTVNSSPLSGKERKLPHLARLARPASRKNF